MYFYYYYVHLHLHLLILRCAETHLLTRPGSDELLCCCLDLHELDLSALDVIDCLYPLLPRNNQCIKSQLWLSLRQMFTADELKSWINLTVCTVLQLSVDGKQCAVWFNSVCNVSRQWQFTVRSTTSSLRIQPMMATRSIRREESVRKDADTAIVCGHHIQNHSLFRGLSCFCLSTASGVIFICTRAGETDS